MPKENTHLWFARGLLEATGDRAVPACLEQAPMFFFLGSVIPDTFFYLPGARPRRMAGVLHCSDPEWAGQTPMHLARRARHAAAPRNQALVLGYLSHLALDRVFHPVVHVLSGKSSGRPVTRAIIARHRLMETALDRIINKTVRFPRLILPRMGPRVEILLELAEEIGLRGENVRRALTVQYLANRLILGRGAHGVLGMAGMLLRMDVSGLRNLCYAQLDREPAFAAGAGRAPESGDRLTDKGLRAVRRIAWQRLFKESRRQALTMFHACEAYWRGNLAEEALALALPQKACD